MEIQDALNQTISLFQIKAADISIKTGIAESSISRYRNGKGDIGARTLIKIIKTFPHEAQHYFFALCTKDTKSPELMTQSN